MKELTDGQAPSALPAIRERSSVLLMPVMDVQTALARLEVFQSFCSQYLSESQDGGQDGGDYGVIPGTKKKVLLKSGAEKLCEIYGLYDEYHVEATENWETGLFDYRATCFLRSRADDSIVGTGLGSCSSFESKYRYRDSQRKCPKCGQPAIIKGKDFRNDGKPTGWLCFGKKGGCSAKFQDGDQTIEGQTIGRIQNEDIADSKNTVLKMAKKRAKIDVVIGVTRSSGIFTQDMEDLPTQPETPREVTTEAKKYTNSAARNSVQDVGQTGSARPVPKAADTMSTAGDKPQPAEAQERRPVKPEGPAAPISAMQPAVDDEHIQPSKELPGCITMGQAVNFERAFQAALRPAIRKDSKTFAHDWLKSQSITVDGKGSAYAIFAEHFYDVRTAAVEYAKSL